MERPRRAQRARREEERIAGQKRRHDEARLREDDHEQQRVNPPRAVDIDKAFQVAIDVKEEIEQWLVEFEDLRI